MVRRLGWLWPALILLLGAGYQCLIYSAAGGGQIEPVRIALAYLPLLALAIWVVTRARYKLRGCFILLAAVIVISILERQESWGRIAAYGMPHTAIYLSLLWLFGQTLWRGKVPLVTRLATRVHGPLPPAMAAYTRGVTVAWCFFFALQIATSVLLFMLAPPNIWSLFINVLNFPLLALMFIGEYGYRIVCHRDFPHATLLDGIRAFSSDAARAGEA